jgi:hypothetical protein
MSSKYKVHPLNTGATASASSGSSSNGGGGGGGGGKPPRISRHGSFIRSSNNNNNIFEEDSISVLEDDVNALSENAKDFGRGTSSSKKDTVANNAISKLKRHHSFSGVGSNNGKSANGRVLRALNEVQALSQHPVSSFISPRGGGSATGNRSHGGSNPTTPRSRGGGRSYNDDDLSVSSLNSNTSRFQNKSSSGNGGGATHYSQGHYGSHHTSSTAAATGTSTRSSMKHNSLSSSVTRSRSGSMGGGGGVHMRKKKVHFKQPLVEYCENTVEYSYSEGADNSLGDSEYGAISGVPRRILRKRSQEDNGGCGCGIM